MFKFNTPVPGQTSTDQRPHNRAPINLSNPRKDVVTATTTTTMVAVRMRSGPSNKKSRMGRIGIGTGLGVLFLLASLQWHNSIPVPTVITKPGDSENERRTTTMMNNIAIITPIATTDTESSIIASRRAELFGPKSSGLDLAAVVSKSSQIPERRPPSHQSCRRDDDNNNDAVQGIYHIAMGDIGGAAGTIFYQFVIAQILYAKQYQLLPWIHFSNVSHVIYDPLVHGETTTAPIQLTALTGRNATYVPNRQGHRRDYTPGPPDPSVLLVPRNETLYFPGTGVWEHYFEPVSDFVPGDRSCQDKLYVTMDLYLITPGLHTYSRMAPKCWRYKSLPDYISQPHLGVTEWLEPQRKIAHDIIRQYIRPRPYLLDAAKTANPHCNRVSLETTTKNTDGHLFCLGIHIRHSDKASGRRVIDTDEFLPFVQAFLAATAAPGKGMVYLATDSTNVLLHIHETWPVDVTARIRSLGQNTVVRSNNDTAVFDLARGNHHHRTNVEVLVEILALSQCQFLVHGFSAVSEAAIWTNIDLHDTSVNLEDEEHIDEKQFQNLVEKVIRNEPKNRWPHPNRIEDFWPQLYNRNLRETKTTRKEPTNDACNGYDGVLLITKVGKDATAGKAFFSSVLHQLVYAERNNLKPWIHLEANDPANALIFDEREHGTLLLTKQVPMMNSTIVFTTRDGNDYAVGLNVASSTKLTRILHGNGIWESYFQPVSDFVPSDGSCQEKPLMELEESAIDRGLVQAYNLQQAAEKQSLMASNDIQTLWRTSSGSEIVEKYYQFQPYILNRADQVNHPLEWDQPCLGVHLRNGDKPGKDRQKISPKEFVPYIEEFANAGGKMVYVASDSHRAIQFLKNSLPGNLNAIIQTQGVHVVRSTKLDWPLHMIDDHHRVNAEVLVDIVGLSRCGALLHSSSTTSEAALYLNPDLVNKSVNLESENHISAREFGDLLRKSMVFNAS